MPSPRPAAYSPKEVMYRYYRPHLTSGDGFDPEIKKIPFDESKVHIEVLSVLWGNRLPILDGSLPLSRYFVQGNLIELMPSTSCWVSLSAKEENLKMDDTDVEKETTVTKMNQLFDDVFHSSCEVLMVKSLDIEVGYLPSKLSDSWLKFKRDYVEGLNDSLDLLPILVMGMEGRQNGLGIEDGLDGTECGYQGR
ncbi:DNA ligase 6 isoform X1 [Tanacetum coccineum]